MPDALTQVLAALAKLSNADRNAILRQLSPDERATLTKLLAAGTASAKPAAPPAKPAQLACSPWLAKRLSQMLEDPGDKSVTSAARAVVRDVMSGQAP